MDQPFLPVYLQILMVRLLCHLKQIRTNEAVKSQFVFLNFQNMIIKISKGDGVTKLLKICPFDNFVSKGEYWLHRMHACAVNYV